METTGPTLAFHRHAQEHPERLCLFVDGDNYSYGEVALRSSRVAAWISEVTDRSNPRVGILVTRSLAAYTGILGAAWAGACYVPLNPGNPASHLEETILTAELDALIVDKAGAELLGALADCLPPAVLMPSDVKDPDPLAGRPPMPSPAAVSEEDMAYLMFTSGTTGKPKGIMVSVGNVLHMLEVLQARYRLGPEDRLSQFFELSFDLSVFDIFMAIASGASLHVVPENQLLAPVRFIRSQRLSVWFSVPSLVGMLSQMKLLKPGIFPSLRLSLFCGEALPLSSAELWQQAAPESLLENLYGPTEATVACLAQPFSGGGPVTPGRGIVAIGRPFTGHEAAVVDTDRRFLPAGEVGELAVTGPQVTPGYWRNERLTEERFPVLDHPDLGPSRWYLTGDQASLDDSGTFHFLGRLDDQVKIRGHRIELGEIEFHLRRVAGSENAVALVHRREEAREIIGVVAADGLDAAAIKEELRRRLPPYEVPKKILFTASLPRNRSGKIDRKALLERVAEDLP